uniref:Uncharacterized protein n=1 Tax=Oryza sativa subsp. japonica TaxID=39947 RepID=Q5Z5Q1_ORYSJ|nr:hypothetical protein [Oryza sativa Japonica Group]
MAAAGDHRGAGAPPPVGCAGVAAFGRAPRLPRGARPSAARALGLAQFFPNPEEEFLEDEGFGV